VLVVEDDPAVRRLARQVLESHGYEVEEAESGDQALAACRARPGAIDLVFSDVVMPGLSGRELARKLGQEDPSIRVLLTSGYEPENGDDESPDERRAPALLAKPFSGAELLRMVRQVLDQDSREPSSDV
jgi:two-component system cell cycle sensor histidine kinase/response regulator CckA